MMYVNKDDGVEGDFKRDQTNKHPDDIFGPKVNPPAGVIFKKDITPARAYDEFAIAVSIWFRYMDAQHMRKAIALVENVPWPGSA